MLNIILTVIVLLGGGTLITGMSYDIYTRNTPVDNIIGTVGYIVAAGFCVFAILVPFLF